MFGAPAFGAFTFGQPAGQTFTPLAAAVTIPISVDTILRDGNTLIANLEIHVETVGALLLAGAITATSGITIGTTAPLFAPVPLAAHPTVRFGTDRYLFDGGIFDGFT